MPALEESVFLSPFVGSAPNVSPRVTPTQSRWSEGGATGFAEELNRVPQSARPVDDTWRENKPYNSSQNGSVGGIRHTPDAGETRAPVSSLRSKRRGAKLTSTLPASGQNPNISASTALAATLPATSQMPRGIAISSNEDKEQVGPRTIGSSASVTENTDAGDVETSDINTMASGEADQPTPETASQHLPPVEGYPNVPMVPTAHAGLTKPEQAADGGTNDALVQTDAPLAGSTQVVPVSLRPDSAPSYLPQAESPQVLPGALDLTVLQPGASRAQGNGARQTMRTQAPAPQRTDKPDAAISNNLKASQDKTLAFAARVQSVAGGIKPAAGLSEAGEGGPDGKTPNAPPPISIPGQTIASTSMFAIAPGDLLGSSAKPVDASQTVAAAIHGPGSLTRSIETPTATQSPLKEISLRLEQAEGGDAVQVHVVEQGGELRVSVHSGGREMTDALRQGLPELTSRLTEKGFHSEVWRPTVETASPSTTLPGSSQQTSDQQPSGHQQQRFNSPQQDRGQGHQNPSNKPRWVEEIETTMNGAPQLSGDSNGIIR